MHIVDTHSHLYPRSYIELLKAQEEIPRVVEEAGVEYFLIFREEEIDGGRGGRQLDEQYWDVGAKLAFMEREGIDRTVVSLGNPWLDPIDGPESLDWARRLNDELSALESETGGRIVGLGVLPTDEVGSAVEVVGEIAQRRTLHGVITGSRICGLLLDEARLDPLWSALEGTGLPLFLHPHYTAASDELAGYGHALPVAIGFPFETTIAVTRLVFAGVLQRFPRLRIVVAHGGGTIPFLAARLDVGWRSDTSARERLPVPPSDELAKLFVDAVLYHPRALRAAAELVGTRRMVFGTDHPFFRGDLSTNLTAVGEAFDGEARQHVLGRTAGLLFRLPELPRDAVTRAGPSRADSP